VTTESARTTANVILVAAGVAAAYVVLTTPPLRRLAGHAFKAWLGGVSLPEYLAAEAGRAWVESAPVS
jgi:hypothetical protein